jgi:hypothetical protein
MDIPSESEIRALDLGALIDMRGRLLAATGTVDRVQLNRYEAILDSTIALATLLSGQASQPPAPEWIQAIDAGTGVVELPEPELVPEPEPKRVNWEEIMAQENKRLEDAKGLAALSEQAAMAKDAERKAKEAAHHDELTDTAVTDRISELIELSYTDAEIWDIIKQEFKFRAEIDQGQSDT